MKKQFVALCFAAMALSSKAVAGFGLLDYDEVPRHMYFGLSYSAVGLSHHPRGVIDPESRLAKF